MHACPFLRVTSVLACNCHVPNWNVLPFNNCFNLYNGRNKSRTPHLFHGILSECVSLICGFLIYVAGLLFPRFPKLMVANLKVKKNLKKIMLSSNRQIFAQKFLQQCALSIKYIYFLVYGCFNPFALETLQITHAEPRPF